MASKVLGKKLELDCVYKDGVFQLLSIAELKDYIEGQKTDTTIGYVYEVVDLNDFDKLRIKIKGQKKPLIAIEELQKLRELREKVFVEFANATITPYWNGKSVEDSFSADDVGLVETE